MFTNQILNLDDLTVGALRGINTSLLEQGFPPLRKHGIDFNVDYRFVAHPDSTRFVFKWRKLGFKLAAIKLIYLPTGEEVWANLDGTVPEPF